MMSHSAALFVLLSATATALQVSRRALPPEPAAPPEAAAPPIAETKIPNLDVYVINLNRRKERCQCMQQQLTKVPHNVYRMRPVKAEKCRLPRDHEIKAVHNEAAEQALFCTNFKIWQDAQERDAEYIAILEDDAILSPKFWTELYSMLQGCNSADYLTIDTWGNEEKQRNDKVDTCGENRMLFRPTGDDNKHYWGTTVQVIKKTYLNHLIQTGQQRGSGALDQWWIRRANGGSSFAWQPKLVKSAQFANSQEVNDVQCGADLTMRSHTVPEFHAETAGMARLQCPK